MKAINIKECQRLVRGGAIVLQEKHNRVILLIDDYKMKPYRKKGSYKARELVAV